jgi:tetratricopeptide (TPR) repeat protein
MRQSEAGKRDEALRCYRTALSFRFDARTLMYVAHEQRLTGKTNSAQLTFQSVVAAGGVLAPAARAELGFIAQDRGDIDEAARQYLAALREDPSDIRALVGLAMIRASAPADSLRDGKEALALARRAMRLSHNGQVQAITALAAARAELGQFRPAQAMAKQALLWTARLGGTNETEVCEERLETYIANKPWRMELPHQEVAKKQ